MSTRLPEWQVASEPSDCGSYTVFVIVDEYNEYADPTRFYTLYADALAERNRLLKHDRDNYDGPPDDPDAWSGGFAPNH